MSIGLDFFQKTVNGVLSINPTVSNSSLASVLVANIYKIDANIDINFYKVNNFQGFIQVSDGFDRMQKPAKIVSISPYGFWMNLLVSIKRIFMGVVFDPSSCHRCLQDYLAEGRRVTVFCPLDGSDAEGSVEMDQESCFPPIFRTVFSCG